VLTLRFLGGLSPEETAATLQRSNGAVRVLQHRALAALRSALTETKRLNDEDAGI
jgi:RNA polymerase sigma-70 factor (ECF subfamily)